MSLLISCFALYTTAESVAAYELEPGQKNAIKNESLVEQPNESDLTDKAFEFSLSAGYRRDNLNWNEAGASVNILSELKWENLEIAQITAAANLNFYSDLNLRGTIDYGSINSGKNQDSDYNGNNRTLEFSRSNNKGGGVVQDTSIGLGKKFQLIDNPGENHLSVTTLAGLSIHQQHLTMTEGFQSLPASGYYSGLNNSYDAQWQGPWVGIDTLMETKGNWSLNATAEFHWADYTAHANWNLRPEFSHPVSFVHTAKGRGVLFAAGATYLAHKNWKVFFKVEQQRWSTGAGRDQTFFSDGSVAYYPLNAVNWESTAFNLGIAHYF